MAPPVAVAGDVHLCPEDPATTRRFLAWLASLQGRTATLVLLGDVFDLWAGRTQRREDLPRALGESLRGLQEAGTRLAFLPGNRDFLFDGLDQVAIELWPDPVRTRWGGRTVLLTHGDQLCTADAAYQRMRRALHGRAAGALARVLPYRTKRWVGEGLRAVSRRETRRKSAPTMDIDYAAARAWLDGYGADLLVAGHVHTGVHHRLAGDPAREVLVLKDWDRGGGVVWFDAGGVRLSPPCPPA
jgi:UDP-2,3-diacylglucosamine hydrolase